jgi:hypothetical protein
VDQKGLFDNDDDSYDDDDVSDTESEEFVMGSLALGI